MNDQGPQNEQAEIVCSEAKVNWNYSIAGNLLKVEGVGERERVREREREIEKV